MGLADKSKELNRILCELPGAVVAYSGGADSAFLAETAHRILGAQSLAVTADSPSLPRRELEAARRLAEIRGWNHRVVRTYELDDENYAANPSNRCYYCKASLFDVLDSISREQEWPVLLGTNTDDLNDHRPGHLAATERGARHPLVEAGLSKKAIRELSRHAGLPTWDKPAAACLASRFAYGIRVTEAGLSRVEESEDLLRAWDYQVVRVRDLGDDRARVEVGAEQIDRIQQEREFVVGGLEVLGWTEVTIDERGYRRGSMNEAIIPVQFTERPDLV